MVLSISSVQTHAHSTGCHTVTRYKLTKILKKFFAATRLLRSAFSVRLFSMSPDVAKHNLKTDKLKNWLWLVNFMQ